MRVRFCEDNTIQAEDLQLPQMGNTNPPASPQQAASRSVLLSAPPELVNPYTLQPANPANANHTEPSWTPHMTKRLERTMIIEALDQTRWNRTKAAELLGMTSPTTLSHPKI